MKQQAISLAAALMAPAMMLGTTPAAQAGTLEASSDVDFSGISVNLVRGGTVVPDPSPPAPPLGPGGGRYQGDGAVISNIAASFIATINGSATVNGVNDSFADPNNLCPVFIDDTASVVLGGNSANGGASVDCLTTPIATGNFANINLSGANAEGTAFGEYTVFTPQFTVLPGDIIDLEGSLLARIFGEITGYNEGDFKALTSNYQATYRILLDDTLVFEGPVLTDTDSIVNLNDMFDNPLALDLGGVDYQFAAGGLAEVEFFAREQVSASVVRAPEPSTIISLLGVVGVGALSRRRKSK